MHPPLCHLALFLKSIHFVLHGLQKWSPKIYLPANSVSLDGQNFITIEPSWADFQTQNFEVCKINYQIKNDELIRDDTTCFFAEWKYIEQKGEEHILEWILRDNFIPSEKLNKYTEEAYNLFVEDPIQTQITTFVEAINEDQKMIRYKRENHYDPESASEVALAMLKKYSTPEQVEEINSIIDSVNFDIQKNGSFEYNYEDNYPIRVEFEQKNIVELGVENSLRIKKTIIKKI